MQAHCIPILLAIAIAGESYYGQYQSMVLQHLYCILVYVGGCCFLDRGKYQFIGGGEVRGEGPTPMRNEGE